VTGTIYSDAFLQRVYLVDLHPYSVALGATTMLRVATEYYATAPSDTPANAIYYGCIRSGPSLERGLFQGDRIGGRSIPARGSVELAIGDYPEWTGLNLLDYIDPDKYAWDGRAFAVWVVAKGEAYSTRTLLFRGVIDDIDYTETTLTLRLRDEQHLLDKALQTVLYEGTGAAEGGEELKGKEKPLLFGQCFNVAPVPVNVSSDLLYQVHDGPIYNILAVRDRGVPLLTTGTASAGGADTLTLPATVTSGYDTGAAPSGTNDYYNGAELRITGGTGEGQVRTVSDYDGGTRVLTVSTAWDTEPDNTSTFELDEFAKDLTAGTFYLLASPAGTVTADVQGSTLFGSWSGAAANIVRYIVQTYGGFDSSRINLTSIDALNALNNSAVGFYAALEPSNVLDVLDALVDSVGGWFAFDRDGLFTVGRFAAPEGDASLIELDEHDIVRGSASRQRFGDVLYRVTVGYRPNWTVQNEGELAGSVPVDVRANYTLPQRVTNAVESTPVQQKHTLAKEQRFDTLLYDESAADSERNRRFSLYSKLRNVYTFTAKLRPYEVELGNVLTVEMERLNLAGGRQGRVFRLAETPAKNEVEVGVFV